MFDTHAIARTLTDAGIKPEHADAITDAVRQAAERDTDTLATREYLDARLAALGARIAWRFIGALVAVASIQTAILIAVLRWDDKEENRLHPLQEAPLVAAQAQPERHRGHHHRRARRRRLAARRRG